ncbi:hypothetical protein XENOCAPTIV_024303, partial [Xenoophorus captivus]
SKWKLQSQPTYADLEIEHGYRENLPLHPATVNYDYIQFIFTMCKILLGDGDSSMSKTTDTLTGWSLESFTAPKPWFQPNVPKRDKQEGQLHEVKWPGSGDVLGGALVGCGLRAERRQRGGEHQNLGLHEGEVRQRCNHLGCLFAQILVFPRLPAGAETQDDPERFLLMTHSTNRTTDSPGGRAGLFHGGHEAGEGVGHPAAGAARVQLGGGELKQLRVHT